LSETENPSHFTGVVLPRRRRLLPVFFAVAVLVLLAGAGFLAFQQVTQRLVLEPQIAGLARELAALKTDVQGLDARLGTLEKAAPATDLAAQLAAVEMRLAEAERMLSQAPDRDAIAALQTRIARVESGSPGEMLKVAAATLARAGLVHAAQDSPSFKSEWEALRAVAPDDPAVAALQPFADVVVPTHAALLAAFPEAARASLTADAAVDANGNFAGRLWARLRELISVRRVGDARGDSNEDRLARAQADLDRGDLSGAIKEARSVSGPAAAPLGSWLRDADARLTVDSAAMDVNARIIQALAAVKAAP